MTITRREFIERGLATFTIGFAAPAFLTDAAAAQAFAGRTLVVLYLAGGNDALSTLVPYTDPFYYSRRPTLALPSGVVLPIGVDSAGTPLGLNPQLVGLRQIFDDGGLAIIQRTGYPNASRSHFLGTDIVSTADPSNPSGAGWLGRFLDTLPGPVDPLIAWATTREVPHALRAGHVSVPAIPNVASYALQSPNGGLDATFAREALDRLAAYQPAKLPHLSFVNATAQAALATLSRVGSVVTYVPTVPYANNGLSQALRAVAGAIVRSLGTRVFWVQTSGFDTHATQGTSPSGGTYTTLMRTLDGALSTFRADLANQGLLDDTLVLVFSEFGRRIGENGSAGTDHGAAGLMMAVGGRVRGGLHGTAASLDPSPSNPTLENGGNDVTHETDFRAVYASVLDSWLGVDSTTILGGNFRSPSVAFL